MTPEAFLVAVWGGGFHSLCAKSPGGRFRVVDVFADPANLLVAAGRLDDHDVWFGLHGMAGIPVGRGGADDVTSVVALAADLDWQHEAHRTNGLPNEDEIRTRLAMLGPELAPSLVVATGHGLQSIWLLTDDVGPRRGGELQARLDAHLFSHGLANERSDLASVLRLPGTTNHKADPVPVTVERGDLDRRYVPEYLAKRLPAAKGKRSRPARPLDERDEAAVNLLLEHFGGHEPVALRDHIEICRPAKDAGCSATVGAVGPGTTKVWSSNWPDLPSGVYSLHELRTLAGVAGPRVKVPPASATFVLASTVHSTVQRWAWRDHIPLGEPTLAAGREKLGKSTAMVGVAARLSKGLLPGDLFGTPRDVLFVSAEDHYARVLKPRLAVAEADLGRVWLLDPLGPGFSIEAARALPAELGLVVLDPLSVFLDLPATNEHGDVATRRALLPFVEMAHELEIGLVGVRHFNKGVARDNPFDVVMGSRAYSAAARSMLFFTPDAEHRDRPGGLIIARGNFTGIAAALRYRLDVVDHLHDDGNVGPVPLFVEDGVVHITLEDALGSEEDQTERRRAVEWLREVLAGGPLDAVDVQRLAKGEEISEITLKRAKKDVSVVSERVGGLGADGHWRWSLPKGSEADPKVVSVPEDPLNPLSGESGTKGIKGVQFETDHLWTPGDPQRGGGPSDD